MTRKTGFLDVLNLTVLVAALGYFVDMFDLLLFPIVRQPSLLAMGVTGPRQIEVGALLLNWQMGGMLLGGILWGILGDKKGRLSTLFGSIALYSVANVANAFVGGIPAYAACRFLAGLGLAGELGAAVTLVSESMPRESRGYGTALVAAVGMAGTVTAALTGRYLPWRAAYLVGGGLGVLLLFLRVGIRESFIFARTHESGVRRGDFLSLFTDGGRLTRYVRCILIGLPMWFIVGILIIFMPEFGGPLRFSGHPSPAVAVAFCYGGITVGSVLSGFLSQWWGTRTKVVGVFMAAALLGTAAFLLGRGMGAAGLYALALWLGLACGYWAVFVTVAAEQFGTNLRATVATTVPNFVRGAVVLITNGFILLKAPLGLLGSAWTVGLATFGLAAWALSGLEDTHGRDLDFVE
ncbi:MFS transporter [Mesoterricola sediminis]|uniref:MFS transporter n=1 Tax=Mesoterricola sediminis TaxID=2927980 RepID=A0AA48GY00_9BACT|nr:MFS transporter [Mesoterricola sediminis]BDU76470.1 MFS transporter [Mesoterricola sediminis]